MYINCYFKIRTRNLQILGVNVQSYWIYKIFHEAMWQRAGYCSCLCGLSIEFEQKESRNYIFDQPNEKASPIFFSYYEYMYCIPFLRNKMFMLDYRLERHEAHQLWRKISDQYLFILMIIVLCKSLMLDEMT